jgi:hypothetical protein
VVAPRKSLRGLQASREGAQGRRGGLAVTQAPGWQAAAAGGAHARPGALEGQSTASGKSRKKATGICH